MPGGHARTERVAVHHRRPPWLRAPWLRAILFLILVGAATIPATPLYAEGQAADALTPADNIACLPFPQPTITAHNGETVHGPYTSDTDRTFITWRDNASGESGYRIERQTVGETSWSTLDTVAANTTNYTDMGLSANADYRYRVRALDGDDVGQPSPTCRRPRFLNSADGNFRIFYRPFGASDCPHVEYVPHGAAPASHTMCSSLATAQNMAATLETARSVLIGHGFVDPVVNAPLPVDLTLCDGAGCVRTKSGTTFMGLRPHSMETPFDPVTYTGHHSMKVPLHETFHRVQRPGIKDPNGPWVTEGQARAIEDKICMDPWPQDPQAVCTVTVDHQPNSVYINEITKYMTDPNRPLPEISYQAVLFWAYIMEKYGKETKEPALGIDFLVAFWIVVGGFDHSHGIQVIDETLDQLGSSDRFEDVFKNFIVANYAKDLPSAPARYRYADEQQPAGSPTKYASAPLSVDVPLALGQQYFLPDNLGLEFISHWGARYYRFRPDADVPSINLEAKTLAKQPVYFTFLGIKNGAIVREINRVDWEFYATEPNDVWDEVVFIVAGMDQHANITLAVNATQPELRIQSPTASQKAQAGDPDKPRKIIVKVKVLSPTDAGAPLAGLDLNNFTFRIAGEDVPTAQIISRTYVQGEYWFVVRPPVVAGPGVYNLQVSYEDDLSHTRPASVQYGDAIESDNVLTIDRSGSMQDFDKLEAAQDAARLYVDSWEEGDMIGVVSFSGLATVDLTLRDWTSTSRDEAHTAIDSLVDGGFTAIGDALLKALGELETRGRDEDGPDDPTWAIILLTDGMENVPDPDTPLLEDFVAAYNDRVDEGKKAPQIHVIALGADADQAAMQKLAADTGGTYHFAASPDDLNGASIAAVNEVDVHNDLAELYRVIAETIGHRQQIYAATDVIDSAQSKTHTIRVDGSAAEAVFVLNHVRQESSPFINVLVKDPDGQWIGPPILGDNNHFLWRVPLPKPGEWTVEVAPLIAGSIDLDAPANDEPLATRFLVEAALLSDLTADLFLGLEIEERVVGKPMPIYVALADTEPLLNASVQLAITAPNGVVYHRTLFDDGLHGDGSADDGFYGNTFYHTHIPGSYQVVANISGVSPLNGPFTRRLRTSFYMVDAPRDPNGIPTWWLEENRIDPERDDVTGERPQHGLSILQAYLHGVHPFNPDSSGGGESDASKIGRGADPRDPTDDLIRPPRWVVFPGAGRAWVHFSHEDNHERIKIFRAPNRHGPWMQAIELDDFTEGFWLDEGLENDQEVCYYLVAVEENGYESGTTFTSCATPRLDPFAPFAWLSINDDAPSTPTVNVMLDIRASDEPEDEEFIDEDEPDRTEGTVISGVQEMMLSNRPDFAGAEWQPFALSLPWVLEPEGEYATVWLKVRDGAGNESDSAFASIRIDDESPVEPPTVRMFVPSVQR